MKVGDAATGQDLLTLKAHAREVASVCFSPDGKRLASREVGGKQITWDLSTIKPIADDGRPWLSPSPRSPDGRCWALAEGNVLRLHRLPPANRQGAAEHQWWVGPDYRWHAEQAQQSWQTGAWFAFAFHLDWLLPQRPWDAELYIRQAHALSRLGKSSQAATRYLQAVLLAPRVSPWPLDPDAERRGQDAANSGDWPRAITEFELAAHQPGAALPTWSDLLLARHAGTKDARLGCREILDRFEGNPAASRQMVDCCLVAPCEESDARRLIKVAQRLVAGRRDATTLTWLGSALYRAGRFEEAARTLQESIKAHGKGGQVDTWLFLAMAQQQLGRTAEARRFLARFERWLKERRFATWQETTRWRLLHKEARRLILTMPRGTE